MDVQCVAQVFIKHFWVPRNRLQFERTQSPVRVTDRGQQIEEEIQQKSFISGRFQAKTAENARRY